MPGIMMRLPVGLTQDEIRQRGEALAETWAEEQKVLAEKKAMDNVYTSKLTEVGKKRNALADAVRTKTEEREVAVEQFFDDDRGVVSVHRVDTMETVSTRDMTIKEREERKQSTIPGIDTKELGPDA
jgi:DNA gyrase/topoisomerase IV subunit A